MNEIMNYVKPELIVVAVVLYFIGLGFKKAQTNTSRQSWGCWESCYARCGYSQAARCLHTRKSLWRCLPVLCRDFWLQD